MERQPVQGAFPGSEKRGKASDMLEYPAEKLQLAGKE